MTVQQITILHLIVCQFFRGGRTERRREGEGTWWDGGAPNQIVSRGSKEMEG